MLKVTVIKTLAKMEGNNNYEYSCQVLRFIALSNDQFEVDVYDMYLSEALDYGSYPAWCHNDDNEKPKYTRRFNDFLSANANLDKLSIGYTQVSSSDPIDAAEELFSLERDNENNEEQEYCKSQHIKDEEDNVIDFFEDNVVMLKDTVQDEDLKEMYDYYHDNVNIQPYLDEPLDLIKKNRYVCTHAFKSTSSYAKFFINEDLLNSLQRDLPFLLK